MVLFPNSSLAFAMSLNRGVAYLLATPYVGLSHDLKVNQPSVPSVPPLLRAWAFLCLLLFVVTGHAAEFELEDMQGKVHRLSDYRGKWVLVNFWATWCPPCLSEIPELSALHAAHQNKDMVVIGIAMDYRSSRTVADFAVAHHINYPLVLGNRKIAAQIGELEVLPTSYLYAPNGEQVSYQAGEVTRESVESYIKNKKFN